MPSRRGSRTGWNANDPENRSGRSGSHRHLALHISKDNPEAADRLLDDFEATCSRLAKHPQLGVARPEIGNEYRLFPVGRFLILYRIIPDGIEVVRVSYGARRQDTLFPVRQGH